jgi:hypothetical protein
MGDAETTVAPFVIHRTPEPPAGAGVILVVGGIDRGQWVCRGRDIPKWEGIMKPAIAITLAVSVLLAATTATAQAQRSHIGPHVGYNFDVDRALIGAQLLLPVGRSVELYPSFDYYFVDQGSLVGFSGDLKFRFPTGGPAMFYFGGGVNFLRASAGGSSNTDTGWDLLFGLESRRGMTHPYVEGRVLNHSGSSFQLAAGLNFTLF